MRPQPRIARILRIGLLAVAIAAGFVSLRAQQKDDKKDE